MWTTNPFRVHVVPMVVSMGSEGGTWAILRMKGDVDEPKLGGLGFRVLGLIGFWVNRVLGLIGLWVRI